MSFAKNRVPSSYVNVVDNEDKLTGVLRMRDLLIADADKPLAEICPKELYTLNCFKDKTEAANEPAKRKLFAGSLRQGNNPST